MADQHRQARWWPRVHLALFFVWVALIPPTLLWWRDSVTWVALMSLWANASSHGAAWQAARTERRLDHDNP